MGMGYVPLGNKSGHRLTKDSERSRIKALSRKDDGWLPSVTDDLRIVEGGDSV